MKTFIYNLSTLLVVVSLLSQSWAHAAPQREPAQQSPQVESTQESSSFVQRIKNGWDQLMINLMMMQANKGTELPPYDTANTSEEEKFKIREEALKRFYENLNTDKDVVTNLDSLIRIMTIFKDVSVAHVAETEKTAAVVTEIEAVGKENKTTAELARLAKVQLDISKDILQSISKAIAADLILLEKYKSAGIELSMPARDREGKFKVTSQEEQMFLMFRQRLLNNNLLVTDAQDAREDILNNKSLFTHNPVTAAKTDAEILALFQAFRGNLQKLTQRMVHHLRNPYLAQPLKQAFADSEQLLRHADNRINQIKANMRKANGTPITQRTEAQMQLAKFFDMNIRRYTEISNLYLRELRVAIQAQQKESEFQVKIRETLPKTVTEAARAMPEAVKSDIKSIPSLPSSLVDGFQNFWKALFGPDKSKPVEALPGTKTEDGRKVISEQSLTARLEGKNLWQILRETWLDLQRKGYIDYSGKEVVDGKEVATFNKPVRVTLTTADLQNIPQEIRNIDLTDLDKIISRNYEGTTESTKNLILMLKDSSLTDSKQSRITRASVREVESLDGGRTRIVELTATNGEKVLLDYTVDPEIAMKSSSPMALTPLHKNLGESFEHAVKSFPLEAGPFYLGLLANTWLNFIRSYESDPMAFERFFHELTSIPGQIGFAGFMVGNHFGQTLLKELLRIKNDQDFIRKSRATRMFIQNFSMAFGSVFSNITHDLIALTAPCAKTLYQVNYDDEINADEALKPCQDAFAAVVNSEKIHQYIQMSLTVMAASLGAAAVQGLAAGAVKLATDGTSLKIKGSTILRIRGSTTLKGFAVMFEGAWKSKPMQYRIAPGAVAWLAKKLYSDTRKIQMYMARTPTPAGLIMTAAHLVLFFQADARANPVIHKFEETLLNSGKELAETRDGLKRATYELSKSDFKRKCDPGSYESYYNKIEANKYSAHDQFYTAENKAYDDSCREIPAQLKEYKERNMMWRDTLMYKFNMAYYSWQQFFSEFMTQYIVVKGFYQSLFEYAYMDPSIDPSVNDFFNPLFQDDPLYGVMPYLHPESEQGPVPPEIPGVSTAIRIQNNPNEGEALFDIREPNSGRQNPTLKKLVLENAKITRLELAAQLIDKHIEEIGAFTGAKVTMGNWSKFETTRMIGNRDGLNDYLKRLKTIKEKFTSFNYETRDFTGIIEGINLLNETYDSYKRFYIKEIIGDGGSTRKMVLTRDHAHVRNSILNLRRFIGKPKPLKKGEAFLVRFDDWVKANYKDTIDLLAKNGFNGRVSEAMLYNAFCGMDYNSDYVMRYENGHEQRGATLNLGFKIPLPWKDGTGLSFLSPKIIDPYFDYAIINKQLGQICHTDRFYKGYTLGLLSGETMRTSFDVNRKVIVDIPNNMASSKGTVVGTSPRYYQSDVPVVRTDKNGKTTIGNADIVQVGTYNKRQYDNMLQFLVDNIDKRIFDTKASGGNLDEWWNEHVSPKIDKAFESYEQSYFKLIDDKFAAALYSEDENGNPFTLEQMLNAKLDRTFYKLPDSLALAYIDEVNVYLGMLQAAFQNTQSKKRELIKQKVAQLPYEQLKLIDEKGNNVIWEELKRTKSLSSALKLLVSRVETANVEAKVSEDARQLATFAILLDLDEAKFTNHLKSIKQGLGKMIESLANSLEESKSGKPYEAQCIGIAQHFGPVMVHFEAIIKALDLYIPTEQGQDYATHPLHYLLNMQKYGYTEMDSSSSLFQSFLRASESAINADIDLKKRYSEEKAMACYSQVNLKGQYDSYYSQNMTEENLNLNILIPQSHLSSAYTQEFMVGLQAAMQANKVDEFYKQLKLDPAEKHKAEVAYVATTSLFETLGHVYNQVTVFKAATQRQDITQSDMQEMQQKIQTEQKGHSGTTPFSGNR